MINNVKYVDYLLENAQITHVVTQDASSYSALKMIHCHDKYEILYIIEGNGRCIAEGREFVIKPHTVLLMPPFEYHHLEIDSSTPYNRWVLHFNKDYLVGDGARILDAILKYNDGKGNSYPTAVINDRIKSVFDRLADASDFPDRQKNSYVKLLLSELMLLLSMARPDETEQLDEELGARVVHYLNEHIDKDVSLDTLSKKFFVSKYYLCRTFKKYNGVSIHGYVNYKRIIYAKHLIDSGESASVAAYTVGFGDYSAFYRAYVKIMGASPTAEAGKKEKTQDSANTEK